MHTLVTIQFQHTGFLDTAFVILDNFIVIISCCSH